MGGWNFPVEVDPISGKIKTTDIKEDIKQSILILLGTSPGERLFHKGYGCNLKRFLFEPVTFELIRGIRDEILQTVTYWEKRITAVEVDIENSVDDDSVLVFIINYRIKQTMERDSAVFTYDIMQG